MEVPKLGEQVAVRCGTEEQAKRFMKYLDENQYVWNDGAVISEFVPKWDRYKEDTTYFFRHKSGLTYGNSTCAQDIGCPVIEFEDLDPFKELSVPVMDEDVNALFSV